MSDRSDNGRFQQARKDWATAADELASQCYADHWGVDPADCYAVESLIDDVHDVEAGYQTHQILDYGGCDRIVDAGHRHIHVAQRWRPVGGGDDLSLRVDNGVPGRVAELQKWRIAYRDRGYYPSVIAFGRYDGTLRAFPDLWLLGTEAILGALCDGGLTPPRHPTGDGTAAVYIPVEDLRDIGAVLAEFDGVGPAKGVAADE
ncbi:MAG: hypothetical protein V5A55_14625 [Halovenus sp.]